jgi:glycosyltransferase involved in cell wall biosynthesis
MRIGLDLRTLEGETGIAQYGRNLLRYLPDIDSRDEFILLKNKPQRIPFWSSQVGFRAQLLAAKINLLHVPGGAPPVFYKRKFILTVHDLAIYRHPEWFPDGQWFSTKFAYPRAIRDAAHIIVPSTSTKNDLIGIFKIKEEKITVIPHGVIIPPLLGKERIGVRYILFLGTIEPRKNIPTLVKAYRAMVDKYPGLKNVELVIAGAVGWKCNEIIDEIRKTQCEGYAITLRGRVSEEEKWQLLSSASCLAMPSFYEGFGMQTLEAMAAGAPVICSNASSLPEAVGEAGLLLDPANVAAWSAGLAEVLNNKKFADELKAKGLARANEMSWDKAAAATAEVYHRFSL